MSPPPPATVEEFEVTSAIDANTFSSMLKPEEIIVVNKGEIVTKLSDPDDGGWVKVRTKRDEVGYVPLTWMKKHVRATAPLPPRP